MTPLFTAAQLNVLWRIATTQSAPGSYCDFQFEIDTGLLTSFRFVQQNVGQNCNGAPTASFNRPVLLTGVFDAGVASVTIASSIERVGNWSAIYFQGTVFPPAGGEWPSCSVSIPNEAAQCCDRIDRQTRSGRSGSVFVAGTP